MSLTHCVISRRLVEPRTRSTIRRPNSVAGHIVDQDWPVKTSRHRDIGTLCNGAAVESLSDNRVGNAKSKKLGILHVTKAMR
jgi:hypothetical protein